MAIILSGQLLAVNEIKTIGGAGANYSTLKAAFDDLNAGLLTGNVVLKISGSTTESTTATLNASGTGAANYTSVLIYPTISNISVSGNVSGPLIDLNGADNVILDGRLNGSGFARTLSIHNSSNSPLTGVSTIRFINDASNNVIRYCILKGAETSANSGVLLFSTTTLTTGNDNNSIINNEFTMSADRPVNCICSEGSSLKSNDFNSITNNNFYNFLNRSLNSTAIFVGSNSSDFTVSNNSFYETSLVLPLASTSYSIIKIESLTGMGFFVTNNFIGGSGELCSGNKWQKPNIFNNEFTAIYLAVGTGTASSVQGNKISNFSWNNVDNGFWYGIFAQAGDINIGNVNANSIGESTGIDIIVYNLTNYGGGFCPVNILSSGTVNCSNNYIGSLSITNAASVNCISKSGSGSTVISNNLIGSIGTVNSIQLSPSPVSTSCLFNAIRVFGSGSNTISNNTISNITSYSEGASQIRGILLGNGTNNVSNNSITRITSKGTAFEDLVGIKLENASHDNTVAYNTITNISNLNSSFIGEVTGLSSDFTGSNFVNNNFFQGLSVANAALNAKVYGLKALNGISTYKNNIIHLDDSESSSIYGIYDSGNNNSKFYHNTVYIDGSLSSGSNNSYAFYSAANTNSVEYVNNIFVNERTNATANAKHYAAFFNYSTITSLVLNYNLYYVSGSGGVLGNFNAVDLTSIPLISGKDINSVTRNPGFSNAGGNSPVDYQPVYSKFSGVTALGVIEDFGGNPRLTVPSIGAWEFSGENMWKGNTSNSWGDATNWTLGLIPNSGDDVKFDPYPLNDLYVDINRTVNSIYNSQPTFKLAVNGKQLTIKADLVFTNGATLDATATSSTVLFSGGVTQTLNSADFYANAVYNFRVNNPMNVVLNGNLNVLGQITSAQGKFDAITNSPVLNYNGTVQQTIANGVFFNDIINALTISNSSATGVNLNAILDIQSNLTINSGRKLTLSALGKLKVNGSIINNAGTDGLVLNSTFSGTASLIHNTNNVPAKVLRYIGGAANDWHFYACPVSGQQISGEWKPTGTHGDGTGYDLYVWNEPNSCWVYNLNTSVSPTWNSVHNSSEFLPGCGYLYAFQTINATKSVSGLLNNGNILVNIDAASTGSLKGFNFIGNPYPSSIDWKNDAGFTRDMLELNGGGYDIWVWSSTYNNYGVYNSASSTDDGTNNITRYISPAMGFFVKANQQGTFVFKNAGRVHDGAGAWLRTKAYNTASEQLSLLVIAPDSLGADEVLINRNFDNSGIGSMKMFSSVKTAPSLYLMNEKMKLSIFNLSENQGNMSINVNFKPGVNGTYIIRLNKNSTNADALLLEDRVLNKIIDLKLNDSYAFYSKTTDADTRFKLHFSNAVRESQALDFCNVSLKSGILNLDLEQATGSFTAKLFDINGLELENMLMQGGEIKQLNIERKGILILKLYNNDSVKTYKLLN